MGDEKRKNIPLGEAWRAAHQRVFEEMDPERRREHTLTYIDEVLQRLVAAGVQHAWEEGLRKIFDDAAFRTQDQKDRDHLRRFLYLDPDPQKQDFTPHLTFALRIDMKHVKDVTAADIRDLPAFRLIHQRAAAHDYAVSFAGFTSAEAAAEGFTGYPRISFNALMPYETGRAECPDFYPEPRQSYIPLLGPAPVPFDRDATRRHILATPGFDPDRTMKRRL